MKKALYFLYFFIILLAPQGLVHAVDIIGTPGSVNVQGEDRPTQIRILDGGLSETLGEMVRIMMIPALFSFLAAILLIFAGIKYITSRGDAKKTAEVKASMVQIVVGLALTIACYTVISAIWAFARFLGQAAS